MDEKIFVAVKLSRVGYGSPEQILKMPTDIVIMMQEYERFRAEYEREYYHLNTGSNK